MQRPIVLNVGRGKDTAQYVDLRLRHEHAASELGGLGTLSRGRRQSRGG